MVVPSRQRLDPVQIALTAEQVDRLVAIAMALEVEPAGYQYRSGKRTVIAEMMRRIADGRLVVAHPATTEP